MPSLDPYAIVIATALVIMLSHLFSKIAKRTGVPSVLLLIGLGVGIQALFRDLTSAAGEGLFRMLEVVGIVGLIMIVLEAALDLELTREKRPLILRALAVALLSLAGSTLGIAFFFQWFLIPDFFRAFLYAIPLSVMSSAIIIPSVGELVQSKREFLVYESAFSDILGIMLFYLAIGAAGQPASEVAGQVAINVGATVGLALALSYGLVWLLQRLEARVKLFFFLSVLTLLYTVGKTLHLSALLIILVFGLVLNNLDVFFRGPLRKLVRRDELAHVVEDFHVVTLESAFVVRTFFFVIFGVTLDLGSVWNLEAALASLGVIGILYAVRYVFLVLSGRKGLFPELLMAPRGLITVLLFFAIPSELAHPGFSSAILLLTILATSLVMTFGLIAARRQEEPVSSLEFDDWQELDWEIEALKSS